MADEKKPNILVIWGDDIGISNLSCYSDGLDGLPHAQHRPDRQRRHALHRLLRRAELHRRTLVVHHRAERLPHRPDQGRHSRVADVGLQAEDPTIAELLKPLGYATGQFGKNHLGDRNEFLPTVHGFDEFFGNLYHLNAEEEPERRTTRRRRTSPTSASASARAACSTPGPPTPTIRPSSRAGACRQAAHRGHRPADQEADGNLRRRVRRRRQDFITRQHDAGRRSSAGSTPPTCTSAPIPSRRASARPGAGSRPTTTR